MEDTVCLFSMNRAQVGEILSRVSKNLKPKAQDSILRRVTYFKPGADNVVELFATNETLFYYFRDVHCACDDGTPIAFAVDTAKLAKFASSTQSETLKIRIDPSKEKLLLGADETKAEIDYINSAEYLERLGGETLLELPGGDPVAEFQDLPSFRRILQIMESCTVDDPLKPHLGGVFTDGDGIFLSTDMFRGMLVTQEDQSWGVCTVLPSDFINMLDDLPGEQALMYWEQDVVWVQDPEGKVVVSGFCRKPEMFPAAGIKRFFDEVSEKSTLHATIDAVELKQVLDRLRGFFSDSISCTVKFDKKLSITGESENRDRMKDVIPYTQEQDSAELKGFSFNMKLSALAILPTLYDGDFTLHMIDDSKPMHSTSKTLGIKVMLTPYKPKM